MTPYDPIGGTHDIARFDEDVERNRLFLLERRSERIQLALREHDRILNQVCGWCLMLSIVLGVSLVAVLIYAVTR